MKYSALFILMCFSSGCALANPPQSRFTMKAIDAETGEPVTNAVASVTFIEKEDPWGNGTGKFDRQKKAVNSNGSATFEGRSCGPGCGGSIIAAGYYQSTQGTNYFSRNLALNRWEPWSTTVEVRMRPIKVPVHLINNNVDSLDIPVWDKKIGFDLEKGAWVKPYGNGTRTDMFVHMSRRFEHSGDYDATALITFPSEGDGIQLYRMPDEYRVSTYKFPHLAPIHNYMPELLLERHATLSKTYSSYSPDKDRYMFRVRTETDAEGNILSACYGRINNRIEIGWGDVIDFNYSFNPNPHCRSLESNKHLN